MTVQREESLGATTGREPSRAWVRPEGSGLGDTLRMVALAILLCSPLLVMCGGMLRTIYRDWDAERDARIAAIEAAQAHERLVAAPAAPELEVATAARGRELFATTCVACHGPEGKGVQGLGKDLTASDFVAGRDDESMLEFLAVGRPEATPVAMPARGGRPDYTDEDLRAIVAYVRGLQDPRRMPELPEIIAAAPTDAELASALSAAGGDEELAQWIANGRILFAKTCAACHGGDAKGMPNLGKDLTTSVFVAQSDEDTLFEFILRGRNPGEPGNTTGVAMPPKGGNPALSDDDILDIVAYLHSIRASTAETRSVSAGASADR
jgi:disulfide bond formation protein DsbB